MQVACLGGHLMHSCAVSAPGQLSRQQGRSAGPARCRRRLRRALLAAAEDSSAPQAADVQKIGVIPFLKDEESMQEVLAFAGPAPERTNGRMAMIGFVASAAAEVATGKSVLDQAAAAPFSVLTVAFLISLASIFPKFASGVPLARLIDATGKEGLPKELAFFNRTHELWLGRVAMLGFTGLVAVEFIKGGALF